ncbi:MAG: VOC family protein [Deltaproteobacteria bacterium]|nr:VOC family protein [Deltaproteobacteria bacterium]
MLTRVDRVQLVVADRRAAADAFARLLRTEVVREDRLGLLAARRCVLQLGTSNVELLEPDGTGPAADFLSHTKGGLFAAGFATADLEQLHAHLCARGVTPAEEGGQLFLAPEVLRLPGLRAVISAESNPPAVGLAQRLYEVTHLVPDFATIVQEAAANFGLATEHFAPIRSEQFGYEGVLTLFHPDRLDRIEMVTPNDLTKTMGRFFTKRGPSLYMCFAEAADLAPIVARLREQAPHDWTGAPDTLFIHPRALGGMMLGVSRTTFAWTWSGRPERVVT